MNLQKICKRCVGLVVSGNSRCKYIQKDASIREILAE